MIEGSEKVPKPKIRKWVEEFINTVLQNKHEILGMHETNTSGEIYYQLYKNLKFGEMNDLLHQW